MPIYGYRCKSCEREFETQQPMSDPPQADCPDCGAAGTRLFYPTGILFKGSGFYKTDSRPTAAATAPAATNGTQPATTDGSKPATADGSKPASGGTPQPAKPAPATTDSPAPAPPKSTGPGKPSSPTTD